MTSQSEVALLRLVSQRLVGPGAATVADAVRAMAALQAQDWPGVIASVALRTAQGTRTAVEQACRAGEVVRSWPMRGTLHLVAAEDLPWMLALAAPRVLSGAAARRAQLGLDPATLERARELAVHALEGGRRLRRADLMQVWGAGGVSPDGQRGYHLLVHLAQSGTLCLGPVEAGQQLVVLVDEWITRPRRLDREEALGEWAGRYFRGHGPATAADFSRWTGLRAADVRAGIALARPGLARTEVDGVEHLLDPRAADLLSGWRDEAGGVLLLPGFDELLLGYGDRSAALPVEFAPLIAPGGNGVFRPTVVSAGQVVGVWKHTGRGSGRGVSATPFGSFAQDVAEAIPLVHAALVARLER